MHSDHAGATPPCPLCGAGGRRAVGAQIVPDLNYAVPTEALPYRTTTYQACRRCGTVSQHPLPSAFVLDNYYKSIGMERHVPGAAAYKEAVYADRLDLLQAVTGLGAGRCLEVGCGNGVLLGMIARQWGLEAVGLEPSDQYDTAEETAGVTIVRGTLEQLEYDDVIEPGSFDLVICRHVLEHVPDPSLFLDHLAGIVGHRGWLLLEVPSSLILSRAGGHHTGLNIHAVHLHHFTGAGLTAALAERGLGTVHLSDRAVGGYPSLCLIAAAGLEGGALFTDQLARQELGGKTAARRLVRILQEQDKAGRPLLIWGAGADLLTVLEHVPDGVQGGLLVYDRNPQKQGKTLLGARILGDSQIADLEPGLILAGVSNRTLIEDIQDAAATRFPGVPCLGLFSTTGND
ncbi:class I SAM-dependent methyltransferase [bacterium]|nr:class I SAM-dependent methyltransferase [bacterium]